MLSLSGVSYSNMCHVLVTNQTLFRQIKNILYFKTEVLLLFASRRIPGGLHASGAHSS